MKVNTDIKVATILDELYYECLKYECNVIQLSIYNYKDVIINEKPDFLLVESAWEGVNGQWVGRLGCKDYFFMDLINLCKKNNIPTVFWNKEDPVNFRYFIDVARMFDYIFTTDIDSIIKYKEICCHNNIFVLPHGVQIKIHNCIDKDKEKIGTVAFAGAWYGEIYPDRKKDMEIILNPALKYNLHIYDRNHNKKVHSNFKFPFKYTSNIKGALSYIEMSKTYKKYDVFLNVNTVKDSPTMHSMRVFEVLACGINLISTYSKSIEQSLKNIVKISKNEEDTDKYLSILINNKEYRDRLSVLGQREVFNKHTYTHRLEAILEKLGISKTIKYIKGVSIISIIGSIDELNGIVDNYVRQNYEEKELIVILDNINDDLNLYIEKIEKHKNIKVFNFNEKKIIKEFMDFAYDKSNYEYISKFDSNNYYGSEFIGDLMNAFKYTDAQVVGKCTYYIYLENDNLLGIISPNMENMYVNKLAYSSYIFKKGILDKINLSYEKKEFDDEFIEKCIENNISIYSTDRFNFAVQICEYNESIMKDISNSKVINNYKSYVTI